jgi:hypothetical protein
MISGLAFIFISDSSPDPVSSPPHERERDNTDEHDVHRRMRNVTSHFQAFGVSLHYLPLRNSGYSVHENINS